jgi:hypothetical protein
MRATDTEAVTNTYNGWRNRETWLASLWLTNDQASYWVLQAALREQGDSFDKANWLEQQLRDQLDGEAGEASMWSDLLSTAFARIDWVEVVENNL